MCWSFRLRISLLLSSAVAAVGWASIREPADVVTRLAVEGRANASPWVAADGSFAAVAWGASAQGGTDVFVAISHDGGARFEPPVRVNAAPGEARLGGELPPRVAIVPDAPASLREIVAVWTARTPAVGIKISRSRDGGRTFGEPVALQSAGAPGDRGWPALALDTAGTPHVIWVDHRGLVADRAGSDRSHGLHDGVAVAQKSAVFHAGGGGSGERELTRGVCYCCKSALAAGRDGALHAAWRHVYPGNVREIAFTTSRDGGRSFAPPVRVSPDGWIIEGCPDDGPAMAVDAGGTVHLVWPTVVGGTTPEGVLFYASTRDGRSFTAPTRVPTLGSAKPSHPQIAVNSAGRVVVAWDEIMNGRRVAALRELARDARGKVRFGPAIELAREHSAAYPVVAATTRGWLAVWTASGEQSSIQARTIVLP